MCYNALFLLLFTLAGTTAQAQEKRINSVKMKVAVWDTYVTKKDGKVMHFDIIVPETLKDTTVIYTYGKEYLKSKGQEGQMLSAKQCRFCHVRTVYPEWQADITQKGYYILEMENCD